MRWLALVLVMAGCDDASCELGLESLRRVGPEAIDCGVVQGDEGDEALRDARLCVEVAYESGVPFVIQVLQTEDGLRRAGQTYDGQTLWLTYSNTTATGETVVQAQACEAAEPSADPDDVLLRCTSGIQATQGWCGE